NHLRQPFTVDPGRSGGGVREHIYARHISVGDDPSPGHDVPVGVGVFHLSTGFRILIRVLIGIIPASAPRAGLAVVNSHFLVPKARLTPVHQRPALDHRPRLIITFRTLRPPRTFARKKLFW